MTLAARLAVMMFLEFAAWGAWVPLLGNHLARLDFTEAQIASVYGTGALATMLAPLIGGQIADRWFRAERFLAASHLGAAVCFWIMASATSFGAVWVWSFAAMCCYAPTLGLTSAVALRHLADPARGFPRIRLFGTLGWIAAGGAVSLWLRLAATRPLSDCLRAGAIVAAAHAAFSLVLPATPPSRDARSRFALAPTMAMLREPSYAVFVALSFVLMFALSFYYTFGGQFFEKALGVDADTVPAFLLIGQLAEIATLALVPLAHRRLGAKRTIALGIACWTLRYAIWAIGAPRGLVIASQALHGMCFGFVFVVAMIYVDERAPADVRGSAQSFLTFVTYGAGMFVGSLVAGAAGRFSTTALGTVDWRRLFALPAAGSLIVLLAFAALFRPARV